LRARKKKIPKKDYAETLKKKGEEKLRVGKGQGGTRGRKKEISGKKKFGIKKISRKSRKKQGERSFPDQERKRKLRKTISAQDSVKGRKIHKGSHAEEDYLHVSTPGDIRHKNLGPTN